MIFLPVIYFLITLIKAISTLLKAAQWYRRRVHEHNVKGVWWEKLCGVHAPSGHTPMHDAPAQPRGAAGLGTALTIAGVKVLERQFWARIIKEDFTVQCEHHGVLCHVNHTPYNVAGLPRAAIVLIALVPSLGLGRESHWSQRKTEELHPPHTHTHYYGLTVAPPITQSGERKNPSQQVHPSAARPHERRCLRILSPILTLYVTDSRKIQMLFPDFQSTPHTFY